MQASHNWYLDSGCSMHIFGQREILKNFIEEYGGPVRFGNNDLAPITGHGDLVSNNITIKDVSYVEGLGHNLFSIGKFCDKDLNVILVNINVQFVPKKEQSY